MKISSAAVVALKQAIVATRLNLRLFLVAMLPFVSGRGCGCLNRKSATPVVVEVSP